MGGSSQSRGLRTVSRSVEAMATTNEEFTVLTSELPSVCHPDNCRYRGAVDRMRIEYDTKKANRDKGRCADNSKAQAVLGWKPTVSLRESLKNMINWITKHEGPDGLARH